MIIRKPITKPVMRSVLTSLSTAASEAASALAVPPSLRSLLFHDDGTATKYPAYYTEEEWAEHSHLLKDYSLGVGDLREKRLGYCYDFDGVDDYVVSNLGKIAVGSTPSISLWIKPTGAQSVKGIFHFAGNPTDNNPWILLQRNTPTTVAWYTNAGYRISQAVADDAYYFLTLTYDGTTWRSYVNGVAGGTYAGGVGSPPGTRFYLGTGYNGSFRGLIHDFRVYNDTLTADEITYLYTNGQSGTDPGSDNLVAHYPLQEESGATAYDISGNGNHGTITNAVTSGVGSIHQPDAGVVKSYANDEGFSLNASVLNNTRSFGDVITFKCQIPPTETQVVLLHQTGQDPSKYAGVAAQGLATDALADATSLLVDGASITTRNQLYLAICDGEIHEVSMTMNIEYPSWNSARFGQYTGAAYALVEGKIWDVKVNGVAANVEYQVIPAKSQSQDALGGTLTYTGRCPNYGLAKGPAWQGDGSAVYVDSGRILTSTASGEIECLFKTGISTLTLSYLIGTVSGRFYLSISNGYMRYGFGFAHSLMGSVSLSPNTWYRAKLVFDSQTVTGYLNEAVDMTAARSGNPSLVNSVFFLSANNASVAESPHSGMIAWASITNDGLTSTYRPIRGTRNIWVANSDGTYAVIADTVKNGALATLYSDGDGSWQLPEIANGAHFDGTGLYPAAPGASVAANGNALNIPANKHPIGLLVDRTGGVAAPFDYQSGADGYTNEAFSDIPTENTLNKRGLSIYAADRYGAALEDIQS